MEAHPYAFTVRARVEPRPPSFIWGDETAVMADALAWATRRAFRTSDPTTSAEPASKLAPKVGKTITEDGIGHTEALRIWDEVLLPATRAMDHPMNLAYIPTAPTRAALAFDAAVSSANVFGGLWETGAGAIYAENEALRWLMDLLDWPDTAGGCFVSGGSFGNLSALAAARHIARERTGRPDGGWKIACTASAHSSITVAANLLDADIIKVPDDERGHLTGAGLRAVLKDHPDIFVVAACAGATNAGIIDDLDDLADVCHEHGIWLHVDGAYGGAALCAPSARDRFKGIERADSFIVDPHKWLFATYDCCALVFRDPTHAMAAHAQYAGYLDAIDRDHWNPADLAPHLSRRVRGLPFWYSLATHGTKRYEAAVEQTLRTARTVADVIRDDIEHLELVLEPELSVVVFRRPGWNPAAYQRWSDRLAKEGTILCTPTKFHGETVLRLAFVNPDTDAWKVIDVLEQTMTNEDGS